ncbi:hypothetical protein H0H87_007915 [Tephrocybe sp. NHM501043]|nr:hypothetical protein H0H87_007915 [Tephrocybe sp. NHM501043]
MLSLFRHVARRPVVTARPLVAHYSDAAKPSTEGMHQLSEYLSEAAEKQAGEKGRTFAGGYTNTRGVQVQKWNTFKANRFVKPHDFTYKSRFNAQPTYQTRRPTVGPAPSQARYQDPFHQFELDPVSLAMNRDILSHYVSEMGKTYGRNITGLTSKSQRRMGKAIRRAKMMGIIPVLSKSQQLLGHRNRS